MHGWSPRSIWNSQTETEEIKTTEEECDKGKESRTKLWNITTVVATNKEEFARGLWPTV